MYAFSYSHGFRRGFRHGYDFSGGTQNLGCVIIFSLFRTLFGLLSNVYGIHFFLVNCFIVRGEEMYISFVL